MKELRAGSESRANRLVMLYTEVSMKELRVILASRNNLHSSRSIHEGIERTPPYIVSRRVLITEVSMKELRGRGLGALALL